VTTQRLRVQIHPTLMLGTLLCIPQAIWIFDYSATTDLHNKSVTTVKQQ